MSSKEHNEMGFLEHLEELRWRLVRSFIAILIGSALSYGYIDQILGILLYPSTTTSNPIVIQSLQVQSMFLIKWFISFASGFHPSTAIFNVPVLAICGTRIKGKGKEICSTVCIFCVYIIYSWCFIWIPCSYSILLRIF